MLHRFGILQIGELTRYGVDIHVDSLVYDALTTICKPVAINQLRALGNQKKVLHFV